MSNSLNRYTELRDLLEHLNLGGMATVFTDLALKAAKEGLTHEGYLYELAKHEEEQRIQRRTERLLRQSSLPRDKVFRTFDLGRLPTTFSVTAPKKTGVWKVYLYAYDGQGNVGIETLSFKVV